MKYRDKLFLHDRKPCEWLKTFAIYAVKCKAYLTGMVGSSAAKLLHYGGLEKQPYHLNKKQIQRYKSVSCWDSFNINQ